MGLCPTQPSGSNWHYNCFLKNQRDNTYLRGLLMRSKKIISCASSSLSGFSLWLSWSRICLPCGRPGFDPWIGKIPWRRERLPTPVFWPGVYGVAKSRTRLSDWIELTKDSIKHFLFHNLSYWTKNFYPCWVQTWLCCLAMGSMNLYSIVFSSSQRDSVPQELFNFPRVRPQKRMNNHFVFNLADKNSQDEKLSFTTF